MGLRKIRGAAFAAGPAQQSSSLEEFGSEDSAVAVPPADSPAGVAGRDAARPEAAAPASAVPSLRAAGRPVQIFLALLVALAVAAGGAALWKLKIAPARAAAASGSLTIESDPAGLTILAAGVEKGRTPLTLALPAGTHQFELVRDGAARQPLTVVIQRGATVVHHVKFEAPALAASATGTLVLTTDPGKLKVVVDGVARGVSPVTVEALAPGSHKVDVHSAAGVLSRTVDIVAGQTASVIVTASATAPPPGAGWIAVASPIPVQLFESGDLIGTSDSPRLMLPSGRHSITVTNQTLGYSETKVVQVPANGSAALRIDLPRAPMSLNALPWAQAWIDGVAVGETPIGNHLVTIGSHEVIFRHPDLGERRQSVTVTTGTPARVSVDMRKPKS